MYIEQNELNLVVKIYPLSSSLDSILECAIFASLQNKQWTILGVCGIVFLYIHNYQLSVILPHGRISYFIILVELLKSSVQAYTHAYELDLASLKFFHQIHRLNNYTKSLSFAVLHLRNTGKGINSLLRQCLNPNIAMKVCFGRAVKNSQKQL